MLWQQSDREPELSGDLTQFAVQAKSQDCCTSCGSKAYQRLVVCFPAEMILPVLHTRMERAVSSPVRGSRAEERSDFARLQEAHG